jgi:hypothetical protein
VVLLAVAAALVIIGNLYPDKISFLLAMRYYAGNWATSVWLFRGGAENKLDTHIKKVAPAVRAQLTTMYGPEDADLVMNLGNAWRAMHHHGRALNGLMPRAISEDLTAYEVIEGEMVAGIVLGWNFGDGHLHDEQLVAAVQERCGYAEGDVRVIMLESQPIHRPWQHYRIVDAATGVVEEGHVLVSDMVTRQPWLDGDATIPVTVMPKRTVVAPVLETP